MLTPMIPAIKYNSLSQTLTNNKLMHRIKTAKKSFEN